MAFSPGSKTSRPLTLAAGPSVIETSGSSVPLRLIWREPQSGGTDGPDNRAVTVYLPGRVRRSNIPSAASLVVTVDHPSEKENDAFTAGCPSGRRTRPRMNAVGSNRIEKSAPDRSSPLLMLTAAALEGSAVPGK